MLGTLAALLLSAPMAETASAAATAAVDENAARDAARAAKAAARAERQAERAAAKAERQRAIADAKAARAAKADAPAAAAPAAVTADTAAAADTTAPSADAVAPAAQLSAQETAKRERQKLLAERKAERQSVKEQRKAALAAAKAEKRAAAAAERAEKKAARADKVAAKKHDRGSRYKTLFVDNGFTYYLDAKDTRWIPRPYNSAEYIIDTWVRLVENTTGEAVAEDGKIRPAKYFLEHYYISPQRREIMFISQLEVTGRPENAVKERPYDPRNWEQLVPGSIEDAIFEAVTKRMSSAPGAKTGGMSVRDMVEEYARISF